MTPIQQIQASMGTGRDAWELAHELAHWLAVVELLRALKRVHDTIPVGDGMTATVYPSSSGYVVRRSDGAELHATSKKREWRCGVATLYPTRSAALEAAHLPQSGMEVSP